MIKQILDPAVYAWFAELALFLFATVFVAIVIRTLAMKSGSVQQHARIVLDETPQGDAHD